MHSKSLIQFSVDGWSCVPSLLFTWCQTMVGFPDSSAGKESTCNAGDLGSIPGLGRSPGEGKAYPLQYFGLENSMDCIVYGVTKSRTQLSDFHSQTMVEVMKVMETSIKGPMHAVLHSMLSTLHQATGDPHLCRSRLDTPGQV